MKNIRKVIYALIVLNLVVDAAFLVLAPDQVAVHFGASGEADRIGSKYEHLWFPALALAFGLGLPFIAKRSDAHDGDKLLKADVVLLALMAVFSLFVFADGLSSSGSPFAALDLNVGRGAALVAGIAFFICGNIMPKSDRNEAFGLRTPWSLSNDEVWRKSQRFGGYAMIASGVLTVVAGLALPMNLVMPAMVAILLAAAGASIVASYVYYRKHYDFAELLSSTACAPSCRTFGFSPVTRKIIAIMRAHPARSAPVNAVPSHSVANSVALTGSTAPSRLPCTDPTTDTPCRYSANAANVPTSTNAANTAAPAASSAGSASGSPSATPLKYTAAATIPPMNMPMPVTAKLPQRANSFFGYMM